MSSYKIKRINADIESTINEIIFKDSKDEFLKSINITGCDTSSDLGFAKIYFTSLKDIDHKSLESEVNKKSSFIRTKLAEKLNLRHTPTLKFIYDESIEHASKIESIINKIHQKDHE